MTESRTASGPPLPAALAPWQAWLTWLAPEQIVAMGELLPRLAAALGAFHGPRLDGDTPPVGVDDLQRRGPYHRLLLSEWAVAEVEPDEFLRRASSGEHLFLSPRRITSRADARLIALFDSGPAQLGAPRLVQVALWILLARRAQAAGLRYCWGTLANPTALHAADSAERLKAFLAQRTLLPADAAARAAWATLLAAEPPRNGERWCIGERADDPDLARGCSHGVGIRREWLGTLAADIHGPGGRRAVDLPLPASAAAAGLLRGRFAYEVTPSSSPTPANAARLSLQQPPLIGPGGERIAVPLLDESVAMIYTLPRKEGEAGRVSRSMAWARGRELVGAALGQKHFAGIIADTGHLHFWNFAGFRTRPRPDAEDFRVPPGQAHWRPCAWLAGGRKPHDVYLLDNAGHLHRWRSDTGQRVESEGHQPLVTGVLAITRLDSERLVYVRAGPARLELLLHHRFSITDQVIDQVDLPRPVSGLRLHTRPSGSQDWTALWCFPEAADDDASTWCLRVSPSRGRTRQTVVRVAADVRVIGMAPWPGTAEYGLVTLSPDRLTLQWVGAERQSTLYQAAVPIATASVGSDSDVIALLTEQRNLVVLTIGGVRPLRWDHEPHHAD